MRVFQSAGDVQGDMDRVADRQLAEAVEQSVGAAAVDVFQHEIMLAGVSVLAEAEAADDGGMVQQGAAFGLTVEAIDVALIAGQMVAENLDRYLGIAPFGVNQVDLAHPA